MLGNEFNTPQRLFHRLLGDRLYYYPQVTAEEPGVEGLSDMPRTSWLMRGVSPRPLLQAQGDEGWAAERSATLRTEAPQEVAQGSQQPV